MSSSSSLLPPQPSAFQLPPWPLPQLLSLLSELCAQPDIILLLPLVEAEATAPSHVSAAFQGS